MTKEDGKGNKRLKMAMSLCFILSSTICIVYTNVTAVLRNHDIAGVLSNCDIAGVLRNHDT